jgi:Mce-associated membrane protein
MAVDVDATDTRSGHADADPGQLTVLDEDSAVDQTRTGDADGADGSDGQDAPDDGIERRPPRRHTLRLAVSAGLLVAVALGALTGWLGFRAHQSHQLAQQHGMYLAVARQGALNLTTISYTEVDADIKRILDSATGQFYDDFQKRSQPFVEVVKQAQSKSQGTITQAGLESVQGDTAQALVAVSVTTSNAGAADQQPRAWRMRISVQKTGDTAKVSNVEFVP